MKDSAEKNFYLNQLKKENKKTGHLLNFDTNIEKIRKELFSEGTRYHIIENTLDKSKIYNTFLEIGVGDCSTLKYYSETYNVNKIIGYDIAFSEDTYKQNKYKNVHLYEANFNNKLPLENNSVDCMIMMMVIEHLFNPFHSFSEIQRLLSKDGLAFINLPLVTSIKNRLRLLLGNLPETSVSYKNWFKDEDWDGSHLHYFSIDSIKRLCTKYNLEIIKIAPVGEYIFLKKIFPSFLSNEISFCVKKNDR